MSRTGRGPDFEDEGTRVRLIPASLGHNDAAMLK